MNSPAIRRVSIIGSGLIGTSVALALRRAGVHVTLSDREPGVVAEAVRLGAGVALTPDTPAADVVVIASPPSTVAGVLRDAQARGLGRAYTDVAGTKARVVAEAAQLGCDLAIYVPGHPMAGRELSGPGAARADLFAGRPWVLCPSDATRLDVLRGVTELTRLCGAAGRILSPEAHDRVVAAVSHTPQVVSAALAATLEGVDERTLSLAGTGLMDTTRIARSSPGLWDDILWHNAEPVADVLEAVVRDLAEAAAALRSPGDAHSDVLIDLLHRGNRGRERMTQGGVERAAEAA